MEGQAKYVDIENLDTFQAPNLPTSIRRVAKIDLERVRELAELGMKPQAIGPALGLSVASFRRQWEKKAVIREAYETGNAKWQETTLRAMAKSVQAGGKEAVTAAIFTLKQSHGANWSDHVVTEGDPKDNEAQKVFAARQRKTTTLPPPPKLIEIEK